MGVWLRIPLIHPEALDPELKSRSSSVATGDEKLRETAAGEDHVEDNGTEAAKSVESNGHASKIDEAQGTGVEDPWQTWNAVRVLCEHKSW